MAKKKRIPLLGTIVGLPSFPGLVGFVLGFLFLGGVLQASGTLEASTILGVP